jgi:transcriptional regulator with XRE-family HTH domain
MSQRNTQKPDLRKIGLRIRGLRENVRQEEFSAQLGISQGQLSKIEGGKLSPSLEILLAVANKFEKSLDWIVKGDGN